MNQDIPKVLLYDLLTSMFCLASEEADLASRVLL